MSKISLEKSFKCVLRGIAGAHFFTSTHFLPENYQRHALTEEKLKKNVRDSIIIWTEPWEREGIEEYCETVFKKECGTFGERVVSDLVTLGIWAAYYSFSDRFPAYMIPIITQSLDFGVNALAAGSWCFARTIEKLDRMYY